LRNGHGGVRGRAPFGGQKPLHLQENPHVVGDRVGTDQNQRRGRFLGAGLSDVGFGIDGATAKRSTAHPDTGSQMGGL
jgi:hypothetical protein